MEGRRYIRNIPLRKVITWLKGSEGPLKDTRSRNQLLLACLEESVAELKSRLGEDPSGWQYGQEKMHHSLIKHPLSNAVNETLRKRLDHGPLPRSGYSATPGVTSNSNNQTTGASFRMVADLADWDRVMFTNTPGQSGDPRSPYYGNLFASWAEDRFFPVYFSRPQVEIHAAEKRVLRP